MILTVVSSPSVPASCRLGNPVYGAGTADSRATGSLDGTAPRGDDGRSDRKG